VFDEIGKTHDPIMSKKLNSCGIEYSKLFKFLSCVIDKVLITP